MSAETRGRLRDLLDEPAPDLAEANLLIACEAYPRLDVERHLAVIDRIAEQARAAGGSVEAVCATLRERDLRGDRTTYDDPRNSFLHEVLDRRCGLPIALSVLTVAVAERIGAPIAPVGMPGHFIVADVSDAVPRYLDPFDDWRERSVEQCAQIVRSLAGAEIVAEDLAPTPPRAVVRRMLANLTASYVRREDLTDALWTVELAMIVDPDDPALREHHAAILGAMRRGPDPAGPDGEER